MVTFGIPHIGEQGLSAWKKWKDVLIVTKRKVKIKELGSRGCRDGGKELEMREIIPPRGDIEGGEKRKESRGCADTHTYIYLLCPAYGI